MLVAGIVVATALAVGLLGYVVARRWPRIGTAPAVDPTLLADEALRHPTVADAVPGATPAEVTGVALGASLGAIVIGVAAMGALFVMIQTETGLARWDLSFARFGADHASEHSTDLLRSISLIGGTPGVLVLTGLTLAFSVLRGWGRAVLAFLVLCNLGQFVLSNAVKVLVDRGRPDILHLTGFSGSSFPSGHSTAAAAALMGCALVLSRGQGPRARALIMAAAAATAGAVAATRVLLGVHWFTDVLAGLVLGWLWFAVCSMAFGGRVLRFGAPVEEAEVVVAALDEPETDRAAL